MTANHLSLASALVSTMQMLAERGLNTGAAGNASVRLDHGLLITPSAVPAAQLTSTAMVELDWSGSPRGTLRPSSEWQLHRDIYRARPEVGAVVHTHSPYATAVACTRRSIPPFHYMVARLGGPDVRCGDYATFGTAALSAMTVAALEGRRGCLLANHGQVAVGRDLDEALATALELETLAQHYLLAVAAGGPVLLTPVEMDAALERFKDYRPGLVQP